MGIRLIPLYDSSVKERVSKTITLGVEVWDFTLISGVI